MASRPAVNRRDVSSNLALSANQESRMDSAVVWTAYRVGIVLVWVEEHFAALVIGGVLTWLALTLRQRHDLG